MNEIHRRIIEATVALHAEQGVMATSYAQIAARADVAVPTVYKHLPTQGMLLSACMGHIAALAPQLGPEIFDGVGPVEARVACLVTAVFANYRFCAPWMRFGVHEAALVPALGEIMASRRLRLRQLIILALAPKPPPSLVALFETLLDFTAWQRLAEYPILASITPEAITSAALVALLHARISVAPREKTRKKGGHKP
jgi:AcrR family transcriptional regulator